MQKKRNGDSERKFLTVAELQEELHVSRSYVYRLVNSDDFPALRLGKRIVIPASDFSDWVSRNVKAQKTE